jgi:hypothetical protein
LERHALADDLHSARARAVERLDIVAELRRDVRRGVGAVQVAVAPAPADVN